MAGAPVHARQVEFTFIASPSQNLNPVRFSGDGGTLVGSYYYGAFRSVNMGTVQGIGIPESGA
jgi:hypothetical protein